MAFFDKGFAHSIRNTVSKHFAVDHPLKSIHVTRLSMSHYKEPSMCVYIDTLANHWLSKMRSYLSTRENALIPTHQPIQKGGRMGILMGFPYCIGLRVAQMAIQLKFFKCYCGYSC